MSWNPHVLRRPRLRSRVEVAGQVSGARDRYDTIYLFDDHSPDVFRCDDIDDAAGVASQGANDQVIYIGARDPLDIIWPTCDVVTTTDGLPVPGREPRLGSLRRRVVL